MRECRALLTHSAELPKASLGRRKVQWPRGVSSFSPHFCFDKGVLNASLKAQKDFSEAAIKILDSEVAVLPEKLMLQGTCVYGSLWQKLCSQVYKES